MIWENYVEIGYISKAHGIKGEVKAVLDVYDVNEYVDRKSLWLAKAPDQPRVMSVTKFHPGEKFTILAFEDVHDRNEAEALVGFTLLIAEEELPSLPADRFYYYEILDFAIHDAHYGQLGKVDDVIESGPQDLLLMKYQDKEVLIPAAKEVLLSVDREQKIVHTRLPKGLLEIYLEEQ